jgi:DNA-binding NtrC family response regulator
MAKFLVVDSDPSAVHAMTRLLQTDGHEVSSFTAGAHAVDALARESFDAVVTDLEMPHVDGEGVVRAARLHAPRACLMVVSASADAERLRDIGVCFVHDKPIDYDKVVGAVDDCRARGGPGDRGTCPLIGARGDD